MGKTYKLLISSFEIKINSLIVSDLMKEEVQMIRNKKFMKLYQGVCK
jgi:hypothetical protein